MLPLKELVIGFHPLIEAIKSGITFRKVYIQNEKKSDNIRELVNDLREANIPFQFVPKEKMFSISNGNHQGIIGLRSPIEFIDLEALIPTLFESNKVPLIVLLDNITDTRNFGAILRSAEFFGVHCVVIPMKHTADLNEFTIKSSSGALLKMNIARANSLTDTISFLKSSGIQIIGASERSKESIHQADLELPTAIIMGSEDEGISAGIVKDVDKFYKIPREGTIDSLNVSSAAAVFFYELQRQRSATNK